MTPIGSTCQGGSSSSSGGEFIDSGYVGDTLKQKLMDDEYLFYCNRNGCIYDLKLLSYRKEGGAWYDAPELPGGDSVITDINVVQPYHMVIKIEIANDDYVDKIRTFIKPERRVLKLWTKLTFNGKTFNGEKKLSDYDIRGGNNTVIDNLRNQGCDNVKALCIDATKGFISVFVVDPGKGTMNVEVTKTGCVGHVFNAICKKDSDYHSDFMRLMYGAKNLYYHKLLSFYGVGNKATLFLYHGSLQGGSGSSVVHFKHNSPPRAGGWVRDLTQEAVEPNPGCHIAKLLANRKVLPESTGAASLGKAFLRISALVQPDKSNSSDDRDVFNVEKRTQAFVKVTEEYFQRVKETSYHEGREGREEFGKWLENIKTTKETGSEQLVKMPEFDEIFLTATNRMLLINLWQGARQRVMGSRTQLRNMKFEHALTDNIITEQSLDVATMCMFVARRGQDDDTASTGSWHTTLAKQVSVIPSNIGGTSVVELQSAQFEKAVELRVTAEHSEEIANTMKKVLNMDAAGKKSLREKKRNGMITASAYRNVMDNHTSQWKAKGAPNERISAILIQGMVMGAAWRHASNRESKRTYLRQKQKDDNDAARLVLDVGADEYGNRASLGQMSWARRYLDRANPMHTQDT